MAYKPILFNTEMVKAILDGLKTQTRRIVKPQPVKYGGLWELGGAGWSSDNGTIQPVYGHSLWNLQPAKPGDILWVRETWSTTDKCGLFPAWPSTGTHYMHKGGWMDHEAVKEARWFPSIHMPKEAARIFLRVKDVFMERLNNMTEEDAIAEGFPDSPAGTDSPLERFSVLWDKTMKRDERSLYGWYANPWVWVIEFERCEEPEGWCE